MKASRKSATSGGSPGGSGAARAADAQGVLPPGRRALVAVAGLVAFLTFLAFAPALQAGFSYDDEATVVNNPHYRGLAWDNLRWMFTTFRLGHYQPLSWVTLGLDYLVWGMRPFGYHLTNLLLHSAASVVVFFLALSLIRAARSPAGMHSTAAGMSATLTWPEVLGAAAAALLFGLHPLRVESVAWITERRDVQSSLLMLAAVLVYVRGQLQAEPRRRWRGLLWALLLCGLSLFSRALAVVMPVVLLALDVYPLRRIGPWAQQPARERTWRVLLEKLPFVLLAIPFAIIAPLAQKSVGAAMSFEEHSFAARCAQAAYGLVFYAWKTIAPWGLIPLYELREPLAINSAKYVVSALLVAGGVAIVAVLGRRRPAILVAAICYVALLFPVLGFAQSGRQEVADRYSYMPLIGWMVLAGGGFTALLSRAAGSAVRKLAAGAALAVVLVALFGLTWRQASVWHDEVTLWQHAVRHEPDSKTAQFNLASALGRAGRPAEAIAAYQAVLRLEPQYRDAAYNLANALQEVGRDAEAAAAYRAHLQYAPEHGRAHYHLGNALLRTGAAEEALAHFRRAVQLEPDAVEARMNLGTALVQLGRLDEGAREYETLIERQPDAADAHYNLANIRRQQGRSAEALAAYEAALRLRRDFAQAHVNLAVLLNELGRTQEAEAQYWKGIAAAPRSLELRYNLGALLARQGRSAEAIEQFEAALLIDPRHEPSRNALAILRAP